MKRFSITVLLLVLAGALVLSGCQPAAPADVPSAPAEGEGEDVPSFKMAIMTPLSGDVKTYGESVRDAAMMAIEEAQAKGWDIDLVIADTKGDAQEAVNAANKVIFEDGVKLILGPVISSTAIPVSTIANEAGVLMLTPTSTNPSATVNEDGTVKVNVFRACFMDDFQGLVVAKLAREELGAETAAVLYDVGNDYVKGLAEYFTAAFEDQGGQVLVSEAYTKDDTDFSAILGKVANADVDVVFLPDYYNKVNLIANQIKEKGIDATLLGGDGWDSADLEFALLEGGYHSNHYSPADEREVVQNFVTEYEAKYGAKPDALATLAYDGTRMLLQAIDDADSVDPVAVQQAMVNLRYEGVTGLITFDEFNNPVKEAAIVKIEGGEPVFYKFMTP